MKRIYLIGFMGSGKSTIGKIIADKLNFQFLDLDEIIEKEQGMSISDIFRKEGEETFREIEKSVLHKSATFHDTIISTGGGTPCFFDNIDWINKNGISIYLKCSIASLFDRLRNSEHRPLIKDKSDIELMNFIQSSLIKRNIYYCRATHIIDATLSSEMVSSEIVHLWDKQSSSNA